MTFIPRTTAPSKGDLIYYSNKNIFQKCGYGMPNCTAYAHGRYYELTGVWLPCRKNAECWIDEAREKGYIIFDTPRLGAIACWKSSNSGHVAVVEEIKPNGDIVTSNSAWKGTEFYTQKLSYNKGYSWKGKSGKQYELQGFIIPSVPFKEEQKVYTITGSVYMRIGAGKTYMFKKILRMKDKFYADGDYAVKEGTKWLHGECNGDIGWVSSKYMR